jgi:hypothetical protein
MHMPLLQELLRVICWPLAGSNLLESELQCAHSPDAGISVSSRRPQPGTMRT